MFKILLSVADDDTASIAFGCACTRELPVWGIRTLSKADLDVLAAQGLSVKVLGRGVSHDGGYAVAADSCISVRTNKSETVDGSVFGVVVRVSAHEPRPRRDETPISVKKAPFRVSPFFVV